MIPHGTATGPFPAAVLWDFDGTLMDTEPLWLELEREILEALGGTWGPALADELVGTTMSTTAEVLLRHAGRPDPSAAQVAEVADRLERAMHRHLGEDAVRWQPGAERLLEELAAAAGAWVVAVRGVVPVAQAPRRLVVDSLESVDLALLRRLPRTDPAPPASRAGHRPPRRSEQT